MWLRTLVLLCALGEFVQCELDRRDVHRIILKPERKRTHKKHHKHHRSKGFHKGHYHHHNVDYEPTGHASGFHSAEAPYYYDNPRFSPHPRYHNHHEEYHELVNPRPPRFEDFSGYPEEEHAFEYQQASNSHYRKEPADSWTPVPTPIHHMTQKPHHNFGGSGKKSPRRKSTMKPPALAEMVDLTTIKPRKYPVPLITAQSFQQYINKENKPQEKYNFGIPKEKSISDNSYEVHEDYTEAKTALPTSFNGLSPMTGTYHNHQNNQPYFAYTSQPSVSHYTSQPSVNYNSYKYPDYGIRTHTSHVKKTFN